MESLGKGFILRMKYKEIYEKNLMNYLYVLLFVVTAIELNARSYYFKSYEVEDGLSNNNVTCCVQDHYGFMWFGTRDGLNRFDGNKFHIIKIKPSREEL